MENTNQFLHLNASEMLALWKKELRLEPVVRDCIVERDDGIDIDALLELHSPPMRTARSRPPSHRSACDPSSGN